MASFYFANIFTPIMLVMVLLLQEVIAMFAILIGVGLVITGIAYIIKGVKGD